MQLKATKLAALLSRLHSALRVPSALALFAAFGLCAAAPLTAKAECWVRFTITKKYPAQSDMDTSGVALGRFALYDASGNLLNDSLVKTELGSSLTDGHFWYDSRGWNKNSDTTCENIFKASMADSSKMYYTVSATAGKKLEEGDSDYHMVFTMRLSGDIMPVKYNLATADSNASLQGRYPTSWKVETSTTGGDPWTVVSEINNVTPPTTSHTWYNGGGTPTDAQNPTPPSTFYPLATSSTYTPIEYIKTTRHQSAINTGYCPNPRTWMEVCLAFSGDFQISGTRPEGTTGTFFGCLADANNVTYSANFGGESTQSAQVFVWAEKNSAGVTSDKYKSKTFNATATIKSKNTITFCNGSFNWGSETLNPLTKTTTCTNPLYILGTGGSSGPSAFGAYEMTVYSWKIYESDDGQKGGANQRLLHNYVPVKNSSGVPGLYDLVTGEFYSSTSGTDFEAGDNADPSTLTFLERLALDSRRVAADADPSATGGDIILKDGEDYIHIFSQVGSSMFTVNNACYATALLVGGGGGGGANDGGGGGAGGMVEVLPMDLSPYTGQSVTVTVGAGAEKVTDPGHGKNGSSSSIEGIATAYGGGGGGYWNDKAGNGGEGCGSGGGSCGGNATGTAGTPGVSTTTYAEVKQGNDGGKGSEIGHGPAGGGGGAGLAAAAVTHNQYGGNGGVGRVCSILGGDFATQCFAGGGGGGSVESGDYHSSGGSGGGGDGASSSSSAAKSGEDGLGGGGGGGIGGATRDAHRGDGAAGGSGIVIIRVSERAAIPDVSTLTVTLSGTSATYTGSSVEPTITVKDGNTTLVSGVLASAVAGQNKGFSAAWSGTVKNAGNYTLTVTGDEVSYTGSTTATFTVAKFLLNPSATATSTYTGTTQDCPDQTVSGKSLKGLCNMGTGQRTPCGTQTVSFTLKDTANYTFPNNATVFNVTWTVNKGNNSWTQVPAISTPTWSIYGGQGTLTPGKVKWGSLNASGYATEAVAPATWTKDGVSQGTFSGTLPTEKGVYTITYTCPTSKSLQSGLADCWDLPPTSSHMITFEIVDTLNDITPPHFSSARTFKYDGTVKSVTLEGFDSNTMTKEASSVENATTAGIYKVYVTPKSGNCWSDDKSTATRALEWGIVPSDYTEPFDSADRNFLKTLVNHPNRVSGGALPTGITGGDIVLRFPNRENGVTVSHDYVHIFTNSTASFNNETGVARPGCALIVGGGGGGGKTKQRRETWTYDGVGGGGGGGGVRVLSDMMWNGEFSVTVGKGGASDSNGSPSSIVGGGASYEVLGGGHGGYGSNVKNDSGINATDGGSGGGGGTYANHADQFGANLESDAGSGGAGSLWGYPGCAGLADVKGTRGNGGGGGGAGVGATGRNGAMGAASTVIDGRILCFGGGGGGGHSSVNSQDAMSYGGLGGGGESKTHSDRLNYCYAGVDGLGGGGAGYPGVCNGAAGSGRPGGSGIVAIRYTDDTRLKQIKTVAVPRELLYDRPYNFNTYSTGLVDTDDYTAEGQLEGRDIGTYTVTLKLKYPDDSEWDDGTDQPQVLTWKIVPEGPISSDFYLKLCSNSNRVECDILQMGAPIVFRWKETDAVSGQEYNHYVNIFTDCVNNVQFELKGGVPNADILLVGGGGGGGKANANHAGAGGGGGAGGFMSLSDQVLPAGDYVITVGKGGKNTGAGFGTDGSDSSIVGPELSHTVYGGGGGGWNNQGGRPGGSGGGAGGIYPTESGITLLTGGSVKTTGQGYAGGNVTYTSGTSGAAAGGGGANAQGGTVYGSGNGGAGGAGCSTEILGWEETFAGGGRGGCGASGYDVELAGGTGGGGSSVPRSKDKQSNRKHGSNGQGGGGGGANGGMTDAWWDGGNGGDGIVIIAYTALSGSVVAKPQMNTTVCRYDGHEFDAREFLDSKLNLEFSGTYTATDAGTYTFEVTPAAGYHWLGTEDEDARDPVVFSWTIEPRVLADFAAFGAIGIQMYSGQHITPAVTLTDATWSDGTGRTLASVSDYTLEYFNNMNIGTATVRATGKGNYTGAMSTTFQIVANPNEVSYYVTPEATDDGAGTGWDTPTSLKTAFELASALTDSSKPCAIYMKAGTYAVPETPWVLSSGIQTMRIIGGYTGIGLARGTERTVLDGGGARQLLSFKLKNENDQWKREVRFAYVDFENAVNAVVGSGIGWSQLMFVECRFVGNTTTTTGYGAVLTVDNCPVLFRFRQCEIRGNCAKDGKSFIIKSGMYGGDFVGTAFVGNSGVSAPLVSVGTCSNNPLNIRQCTFAYNAISSSVGTGNSLILGGGNVALDSGRVTVANTIVACNADSDGSTGNCVLGWSNAATYNHVLLGVGDSRLARDGDIGCDTITNGDPLFAAGTLTPTFGGTAGVATWKNAAGKTVDPVDIDVHLKSVMGRWNGSAWVNDSVTSPAIDAGDPTSDYAAEPAPNGGRVNLGAYGNTAEASKTPEVPAAEAATLSAAAGLSEVKQLDNGHTVLIFSNVTDAASFTVAEGGVARILVVGGGGNGASGGSDYGGGGGGAGGVVERSAVMLSAGTYTVVVGGSHQDSVLKDSSGTALITAVHGGNGGQGPGGTGEAGGSGGGAGGHLNINIDGGTGEPGQGNDGGSGKGYYSGRGGGGYSEPGKVGTMYNGGAGGGGYVSDITGEMRGYACGGGGGGHNTGVGGAGGYVTIGGVQIKLGGDGTTRAAAQSGVAGTGSGGGGSDIAYGGGRGGSGIVVVHLYSAWTPQFNVTLDPNGGTGGKTSVTATYGEDMPELEEDDLPTRDGYKFAGYSREGWVVTKMTGEESDILTEGTKVYAYSAKDAITLNGVAFTATLKAGTTSGSVTFNPEMACADGESGNAGKGDTDYGKLMKNKVRIGGGDSLTVTLGGLAANHTYLVQLVCHEGIMSRGLKVDGIGYNCSQTGDDACTYGRSFVRRFKATAAGEYSFTLGKFGDHLQINALQVRKIGGEDDSLLYYNDDGTSAKPWDIFGDATLYAQWTKSVVSVARPTQGTASWTYDGQDHRPAFAETDGYTVAYSAAAPWKNVGTYKVTFTLKDNCEWADGTDVTSPIEFTYEIKKVQLYVVPDDKTIAYGDAKPTLTYHLEGFVNGEDATSAGVTGAPLLGVTYSLGDACGTYQMSALINGDSMLVPNPLSAPNYSFGWNEDRTGYLTVTQRVATLSWTDISFVYDGTEKVPTCTIGNLYGSDAVTATVAVDGGSAIQPNTYTARVTGLTGDKAANYSLPSTVTKSFTITAKALTDAMVTLSASSFVYNGTNQKPTVTVTDGSKTLVENTDYTLTNAGGTDVGSDYEVQVVGKGNYSGTITKTFAITQAENTWTTVPAISKTTYKANDPATLTPGVPRFGTVAGTIAKDGGATGTFSGSLPTEVGSYVLTYSVAETQNYTGLSETLNFTVTEAAYDLHAISETGPLVKDVPSSWLAAAFPAVEKTQTAYQAEFLKVNASGVKAWQAYVLGFEGGQVATAKLAEETAQNADPKTVTIRLANMPPLREGTGCTVKYSLYAATSTEDLMNDRGTVVTNDTDIKNVKVYEKWHESTFEAPLDDLTENEPVRYYRIKVHFTFGGGSGGGEDEPKATVFYTYLDTVNPDALPSGWTKDAPGSGKDNEYYVRTGPIDIPAACLDDGYVRVSFKTTVKYNGGYFTLTFLDENGQQLTAVDSLKVAVDSLATAENGQLVTKVYRLPAGANVQKIHMQWADSNSARAKKLPQDFSDVQVSNIKVESLNYLAAASEVDAIFGESVDSTAYATAKATYFDARSANADWTRGLQGLHDALVNGGDYNILVMGDSLAEAPFNGALEALIKRQWPQSNVRVHVCWNGNSGCTQFAGSGYTQRQTDAEDKYQTLLEHGFAGYNCVIFSGTSQARCASSWSGLSGAITTINNAIKEKNPNCSVVFLAPQLSVDTRYFKPWNTSEDAVNPGDGYWLTEDYYYPGYGQPCASRADWSLSTDKWAPIDYSKFDSKISTLAGGLGMAYWDLYEFAYDYLFRSGKPYFYYSRDAQHANEYNRVLSAKQLFEVFKLVAVKDFTTP